MRWWFVLLLVPTASALSLDAEVGTGGISIAAGSDDAVDVQVVVSHDDPVLGRVVDRIIPVAINGSLVTAELKGLPVEVDVRVEVLPADIEVANGTRVARPDLATEAIATAPPVRIPFDPAGEHRVTGYRVADEDWWAGPFRAASLGGPDLVYVWTAMETEESLPMVKAAFSRDGGRNWTSPIIVATETGMNTQSQDLVVAGNPWLSVTPMQGPVRLIELVDGQPVERATLPDATYTARLVATDDGVRAVTDTDGTVEVYDASGQRLSVVPGTPEDHIFHVHAAGHGQRMVVAWQDGGPQAAWSDDAGQTWEGPVALDVPHPDETLVTDVVMDAMGAHFALTDTSVYVETAECHVSYPETYHVRLQGGVSTATRLSSGIVPVNEAQQGSLASHGGRLWAFMEAPHPQGDCTGRLETWAIESIDGGLTWGPAYRLVQENGAWLAVHDVLLQDDGTPAFTAHWHAPDFHGPTYAPLFTTDHKTPFLTKIVVEALGDSPRVDAPMPLPSAGPATNQTPATPEPTIPALPVAGVIAAIVIARRLR